MKLNPQSQIKLQLQLALKHEVIACGMAKLIKLAKFAAVTMPSASSSSYDLTSLGFVGQKIVISFLRALLLNSFLFFFQLLNYTLNSKKRV